jgi:hypothetical protein
MLMPRYSPDGLYARLSAHPPVDNHLFSTHLQFPITGRFLLVLQGSEAMKTCPHKHAHALHFGLLLTVSFLLAVVLYGGTRW